MDKIRVIFNQVHGVMFGMDDEERAVVHESVPTQAMEICIAEKATLDAFCEQIADAKARKDSATARELIQKLQIAEAAASTKANRVLRKAGLY